MKKSFLLLPLLLLCIHFASANMPAPSNVFNIYLDGKELPLFDLKVATCSSFVPEPSIFLENDTKNNCTWYIYDVSVCITNPCSMWPEHAKMRFYLEADGSSVLTEPFTIPKLGYYDMYITSDGQVDMKFLREAEHYGEFDSGMLLMFIIFTLFNVIVESFVAYLFFKKNKIGFKNIWWVVAANILTFTIFALFMDLLKSLWLVLLAEAVIILIEAFIYWKSIKELGWKGSFALSFQANVWTIAAGILVSTATLLIFSL